MCVYLIFKWACVLMINGDVLNAALQRGDFTRIKLKIKLGTYGQRLKMLGNM